MTSINQTDFRNISEYRGIPICKSAFQYVMPSKNS